MREYSLAQYLVHSECSICYYFYCLIVSSLLTSNSAFLFQKRQILSLFFGSFFEVYSMKYVYEVYRNEVTFTMLCQSRVYNKVIQLYIRYIYIYTHTHTHTSLFRFFTIIGYYKILNIVPHAMQQVLVVYLLHIQQCVPVNPKLLIYSSPQAHFPLW